MDRAHQLTFCRVCKHQHFESSKGIICKLTGDVAAFENTCPTYEEDPALAKRQAAIDAQRTLNAQAVSSGTRFANFILDYIFRIVLAVVFGIFLALVSPEAAMFFETDNRLIDYFLGFLIAMIYYTTFETMMGRSPAKFITQTKVVMENGDEANFDAILLRSLCRHIPFNAFSFLGDKPVGWHDSLSKTRVISTKNS